MCVYIYICLVQTVLESQNLPNGMLKFSHVESGQLNVLCMTNQMCYYYSQ